jgi:hypothetical protein
MSGETQIEIPMRHNPVSDPLPKLSLLNGTSSGSSTGMHSSGGSTGEDSSGEDQHHHHHHVVVLPKKIRLKDSTNNGSFSSLKAGSSLISMICNGNSRESMHVEDPNQDQDDDDCSNGPMMAKDGSSGGVSTSLTSGEVCTSLSTFSFFSYLRTFSKFFEALNIWIMKTSTGIVLSSFLL